MSPENSATLSGSTLANNSLHNTLRSALNNPNTVSVKYARLQGYLEGYLDQMSASKDTQEELISKILSELGEILNPLSSNNEDR
jgi:hypothetical protein